ncbi:hypothetical protein ACFL0H_06110 [Thermodesulfobacteriota bacterium]
MEKRKAILIIFVAGMILINLPISFCWGADKGSADPVLTLDFENEPLMSVLNKISDATGWKIVIDRRWMHNPITRNLDGVPLGKGLRLVLKNTGIQNQIMIYDEGEKTITVLDAESIQYQPDNQFMSKADAKTLVFATKDEPGFNGRPLTKEDLEKLYVFSGRSDKTLNFTKKELQGLHNSQSTDFRNGPIAAEEFERMHSPADQEDRRDPVTKAELGALHIPSSQGSNRGNPLTQAEFEALMEKQLNVDR